MIEWREGWKRSGRFGDFYGVGERGAERVKKGQRREGNRIPCE